MTDIDIAATSDTRQASVSPPAIEARSVSKKFLIGSRTISIKDRLTGFGERSKTDFWAVKEVSVIVPRGSMLGVIGRNGSGKSTFLRTLCGIYRPTEGEVRIRGRVTALLELGAGFHGDLTGRENVYMNGAVVGLGRSYMESVMGDIVDMADIGAFIDAPVDTYSSGMRARLGFAVSVQLRPEILLADEITAVGDITFKEHGVRRMMALREQGVTIVQVSHSLPMLQDSCDQILWLHHGETMALGDPAEVIAEYVAHAGKHADEQRTARLPDDEVINPGWISRVDIAPEGGMAEPTVGAALRFVIGLLLPEPLARPQLRLRISRANGAPTGLAIVFDEMGDNVSGTATVSCLVPKLPLQGGRYRIVIELLAGGEVVASRKVPLDVRTPVLETAEDFAILDAQWEIR